jgi:DNA excision repair protein ERCC-2
VLDEFLRERHPGRLPVLGTVSGRWMKAERARLFSTAFAAPGGQGIGFAVLGGVFAEGVDLPGPLLIGAFIATLGLPPVSPVARPRCRRG